MSKVNAELVKIVEKFAGSGWDLLGGPAKDWLTATDSEELTATLRKAVEQADEECGSCGCEYDSLYKRALELLKTT